MIDRRDFIVGSAAVAGVMALSPVVNVEGARAASQSGGQVPGYYKTKVGSIEVITLLDGGMEFSDDLFPNAKGDLLSAARDEFFLPQGKPFPAYISGFLVRANGRNILIDAGARNYAPQLGKLVNNLSAFGLSPDDIDDIIITHAHPDHVGGLLDENSMRVFKKANVRLSKDEMDFWFSDTNRQRYSQKAQMFDLARKFLMPYRDAGQIDTFPLGNDIKNGLSSVSLPGHTPGHSGVRIADGRDQLLIWGDVVHLPALQFTHPDQAIAFDLDPDQARTSRKKIMEEVAADKIRIGGMHLCFPALGHVAKRGDGFAFVPQQFETSV